MKLQPILLLALLTLTACGKKENKPTAGTNAGAAQTQGKIAYVDLDSVQEKYTFFIEGKAQIESRLNTYQSAMQQKETALQNLQANIQKRLQGGKITSEDQYKKEVAQYQAQEQAYVKYRQQAQEEMQKIQDEFNQALLDSVNNFIAVFNKDKRYTYILNKATCVYADPACDITDQVVEGLNKRYKK